jgi:hypothetical protein
MTLAIPLELFEGEPSCFPYNLVSISKEVYGEERIILWKGGKSMENHVQLQSISVFINKGEYHGNGKIWHKLFGRA